VDLVEVDRVDAESPEARFDLAPERVAAEVLHGRPVRAFRLTALCEHERALARVRADGAADDLLGVAEAVVRRRVDPVDAEV
jgi:hypothetical protein